MSNQWPTDADVERALRTIVDCDYAYHDNEPPMTDEEWAAHKAGNVDEFAQAMAAMRSALIASRVAA